MESKSEGFGGEITRKHCAAAIVSRCSLELALPHTLLFIAECFQRTLKLPKWPDPSTKISSGIRQESTPRALSPKDEIFAP